MTKKEALKFMSLEEYKVRKFVRKRIAYEGLAVQANQYLRKFTGRTDEEIELNIFFQHCYCAFKALEEKYYRKQEKWNERLLASQNSSENDKSNQHE